MLARLSRVKMERITLKIRKTNRNAQVKLIKTTMMRTAISAVFLDLKMGKNLIMMTDYR